MKCSKNGFLGKQLELFGRNSSKIPKTFFRQKFYGMGLNWYYYIKILQKLEFWGALQNYMGVFGKKLHSFQNRFNGQGFAVWFFNSLTLKLLKISQEFLTFFFFPGKIEGPFEKSLIFQKNWYIFQICSRRRPKYCFCLRILKTIKFRI